MSVDCRPRDLPDEFRGAKIYAMINVTKTESVPPEEIISFCETLKARCETP